MLKLVKHRREACGKVLLWGVVTGVLLRGMTFTPALAQVGGVDPAATGEFETVQQCGNPDGSVLTFSSVAESLSPGALYVKTNAVGLKTSASLYVESFENGTCKKIGSAKINDTSWAKIAAIGNEYASEPVNLVIASPFLGADAYASVATILNVPSGRCTLRQDCTGTFQSAAGVIEPVIVSSPGDLVTVQTIPDISTEKLLYVEYYDGGDFLYVSKSIDEVDKNYLRGGTRTVKKVAYLTNNRLFTITEQVEMPSDPLYSQYIKSTFFRLGSQAQFVFSVFLVLLMVGLVVLGFRRFHAWKTYRNGHGIDRYLQTHK